jgi:transcriptional regulator with XRE-family HTH domain
VGDRGAILKAVMRDTGTTQSELSRLSGIHQPSISQFLSGRTDLSDEQLDRLLSCMGYRLHVSRQAIIPNLTRSERRSWALHRQLAKQLTPTTLTHWLPTIEHNLHTLKVGARGQPHTRNVQRWESLTNRADMPGLHRVLTGLDRDAIQMREVSPMSGLLPDKERIHTLNTVD